MRSANARSTAPLPRSPRPERPARQLEQRERDAAGGVEQPLPLGRRELPVALEHRAGIVAAEPAEHELGEAVQAGGDRLAVARRQQQRDRLGAEPAGDEHERVDGRAVEPLEVVDHAQQRLLLRGLGEHAERAGRGEEAIAGAVGGDAERRLQRAALRGRQPLESAAPTGAAAGAARRRRAPTPPRPPRRAGRGSRPPPPRTRRAARSCRRPRRRGRRARCSRPSLAAASNCSSASSSFRRPISVAAGAMADRTTLTEVVSCQGKRYRRSS